MSIGVLNTGGDMVLIMGSVKHGWALNTPYYGCSKAEGDDGQTERGCQQKALAALLAQFGDSVDDWAEPVRLFEEHHCSPSVALTDYGRRYELTAMGRCTWAVLGQPSGGECPECHAQIRYVTDHDGLRVKVGRRDSP